MKFTHDPSVLFTRDDPDDRRLGDVVRQVTLAEFEKDAWDWAILGLPDDRGVALNGGRPGAADGPAAIRKWLYRLVPTQDLRLADLGDLSMTDSLHADHATASDAIAIALGRSTRVAILGGGHDWGFSPIAALMQGGSVGFVNFDAHLDVRPSKVHHSGTSYWRALEGGVKGRFAAWAGVQRSATSPAHSRYVEAKDGTIVWAEEPMERVLQTLTTEGGPDYFDISLDMDVFTMAVAPGVSAPQPAGCLIEDLLPTLHKTLQDRRVRTFGIYETAPALDYAGDPTSRLAARCLWEALMS